jgi:hypothetical protein
MNKEEFQKLANDFLVQTEEEDKTKPVWETKNHLPILHSSLNEFYIWLTKNYWNEKQSIR